MRCQPANSHRPRATRGKLDSLLRPVVPRSRCISSFQDRDLQPAERRNVQELPRPPTTHTQHPTPPYPTTGKTLAIPTPEIYLEISLVPCLVLVT